MTTVWVLTTEYNDYDQHGEYFVRVYAQKPTYERLREVLAEELYGACWRRVGYVEHELVDHVLAGGGRQTIESQWFYLREQELE